MYARISKMLLNHPTNGTFSRVSHYIRRTLGDVATDREGSLPSKHLMYLKELNKRNRSSMKRKNGFVGIRRMGRNLVVEVDKYPTDQYAQPDWPVKRAEQEKYKSEINIIPGDIDSIFHEIQKLNETDLNNAQDLLNSIDEHCYRLFYLFTINEILVILNKLLQISSKSIGTMKFYCKSIDELRNLVPEGLTAHQIVNLLFLTNFGEERGAQKAIPILRHVPNEKYLTKMEQKIVNEARRKFSVSDSNYSSRSSNAEQVLVKDIDTLLNDQEQLTSLLKTIARKSPSPGFSLIPFNQTILDHEQRFSLETCSSFLRMCAYTRDDYPPLLHRFLDDVIANLLEHRRTTIQDSSSSLHFLKCINGSIWAISMLNYKLSEHQSTSLVGFISNALTQFIKFPNFLCNALLSLWMLQCNYRQLIESCFQNRQFLELAKFQGNRDGLDLFLSCLRIEAPEIIIPPELIKINVQQQRFSDTSKQLAIILQHLAPSLGLSAIKLEFIVEYLGISGVSTGHEKHGLIHFDVKDETTCLRWSGKPNGYLNLKTRLVEALGYHSILVPDKKLNDSFAVSSIIQEHIDIIEKNTRPDPQF